VRQTVLKSEWVEDVADPLLKKTIPFKTLGSAVTAVRRVPSEAVLARQEFFSDLREVSARTLLDLAAVGSGLIEKRSRS
jgi:hypothetical protein